MPNECTCQFRECTSVACDDVQAYADESLIGWFLLCRNHAQNVYWCHACETLYEGFEMESDNLCRECYWDAVPEGDGYCEDSDAWDDGYSSRIRDYHGSYFGSSTFGTARDRGRYFGVEWEVQPDCYAVAGIESAEDMAQKLSTVGGDNEQFMQFENDCSTGADGFECVTAPASLKYHRAYWRKIFADHEVVDALKHHTFVEGDASIGMHVHVSRASLSGMTIAKLVGFIYNPRNWDFVEVIADRDSNRWATYKKTREASCSENRDRYEAVNLKPRHTVEFRLFASQKSFALHMKAIEFVDALCHFCERHTFEQLTVGEFTQHVAENRNRWPELAKFIAGIG